MCALLSLIVDTPVITRASKLFDQPTTLTTSASATNIGFCVSGTTMKAVPKRTQLQKQTKKPNRFKEKLLVIPEDLICCDFKFTKITSYKRHVNRKHPKDVNNDGIGCVVCGKVFLHRDNLLQHQKYHKRKQNKKTKKKFICDNCKTSFTKKTSLIRHFSNKKCKFQREEK